MDAAPLYGGIEAGGTKFVCIVGCDPDHIVQQTTVETTTPEHTLGAVIAFFRPFAASGRIHAIGLGTFGPVDLDRKSSTYGFILATPKAGWQNTNVAGPLSAGLHLPLAIDTDVNAAALGEAAWGAGRGLDSILYVTIGTGIGGGCAQRGELLYGPSHPEMGHIRIPHDPMEDPFPGNCPYHRDCFEGLASGPAIEKRLGRPPESLSESDPFWRIEANYIACALVSYILILTPSRIALGGGIMQRRFLFSTIRTRVRELLNGYIQSEAIVEHIDEYIVPPGLGRLSGVLGALALARKTLPAGLVQSS